MMVFKNLLKIKIIYKNNRAWGATVQSVGGWEHPGMGGGDVGGGGDGGSVRRRGFGTESGMPGGERIEAHQRVFRKQICH